MKLSVRFRSEEESMRSGVEIMSKYDPLWKNILETGGKRDVLAFSEAEEILGFEIDHSFLNYKKELKEYGYEIVKISLKDKKIFYKKR